MIELVLLRGVASRALRLNSLVRAGQCLDRPCHIPQSQPGLLFPVPSRLFSRQTQLEKLAEEREEAAELRSMAKRDAAKEYAVKLDANEKKLKQVMAA